MILSTQDMLIGHSRQLKRVKTLFVLGNKRYQTVLTKKTRSIFEELYNKVSDLHSQVMDRSITVKNLKTIEDHQDGFVAILGDMKVKGFHETKTRKAIKARLSELEEFTSHQTNIKHVIDVFKRLDGMYNKLIISCIAF